MKKKVIANQNIVIYQTKSGGIELKGDIKNETLWATQAQMAEIFDVKSQAITRHLKNIFKEGELLEKATCSKMEQVRIEGGREIKRSVLYYNIDAIISVGYRISSNAGTKFRQWATQVLHSYITEGYVVNKSIIAKNYDNFLKSVADIRALLPVESNIDNDSILELVKVFSDTWLSLDAYDKDALSTTGVTKKSVKLTSDDLLTAISILKAELIAKGEATDIFATERGRGLIEGIIGNVMQSFSSGEVYPTVEEKAAHLLYFIVKNHPFVDGNKRSGAYAFVWFLRKAGVLDLSRISPVSLTAITLLIAESNPSHKEKMISLVLTILGKK